MVADGSCTMLCNVIETSLSTGVRNVNQTSSTPRFHRSHNIKEDIECMHGPNHSRLVVSRVLDFVHFVDAATSLLPARFANLVKAIRVKPTTRRRNQ